MTTDAERILVESSSLEAMKFYERNYNVTFFEALKPRSKPEILRDEPQRCRFCKKGKPDVTFSKDAHVAPAFVGNKILYSNFECNDCNDRFSAFEDDFAKMTMGDRALSQVPKRKGFASLKIQGKKSSFERGSAGVLIKQYADEGVFTVDDESSRIVVHFETQPFRPLGAYKSLAKIAYSLAPITELHLLEELRQWLLQPDVSNNQVYSDGGHWCYKTFVPGPQPFPFPVLLLLKRKENIESPYLMFFICFGNYSFQIFPPCPQMDADFEGKNFLATVYPHLYLLQPWRARGPIQRGELSLDSPERRQEKQTVNMHFDLKVAVPTGEKQTDK